MFQSPISNIPDEILIIILSHVWFRWNDDFDVIGFERSKSDVQSVSLTCRRWRAVSLGYPDFWADIPVHKLSRAQFLYERSGSAPLRVTVDCDAYRMDFDASSKAAATYLPRIRTLFLDQLEEYSPIQNLEPWVQHLSHAGPAVSLEHLRMRSDRNGQHGGPWCSTRPQHVIDAPALKTLKLVKVYYPPTSPIFRGLRDLELGDLGDEYDVPDILRLLSSSPTLERLVLIHLHFGSGDVGGRVALPRLARLELDYIQEQRPEILLEHLVLPSFTRISVKNILDGDALPLWPQENAGIAGLSDIRRLELRVILTKYCHPLHIGWEKMPRDAFPGTSLRIDLSSRETVYQAVLTKFVQWLSDDVHKLETIVLVDIPRIESARWADVLRPMTSLRELRLMLDGDATVSLLDTIANADNELLPSLTSLELAEFSRSEVTLSQSLGSAPPSPAFWTSLKHVVNGRGERDISLTLVDVPCPPEDVAKREEIAEMVRRFMFFALPLSEEAVVEPMGLSRARLEREARECGGYGVLLDRLAIRRWDHHARSDAGW